ncbi:MAG: acyltransferase [Pseudomonadota bacterium]|nr:acyltransferase [Pseudomonadota bacterium]
MLYGFEDHQGVWLRHTRVHAASDIVARAQLEIGDHVYVGPFNLLDASGGLTIGEGVQITSHCVLLTHSSHHALRRAGRRYWGIGNGADAPGFVRAATRIGDYSFIGPHSVIAPGARVGRGVIVRAFSYVSGVVPDFAIVAGQPARVVGDTRSLDQPWLVAHPQWRAEYEAWSNGARRDEAVQAPLR